VTFPDPAACELARRLLRREAQLDRAAPSCRLRGEERVDEPVDRRVDGTFVAGEPTPPRASMRANAASSRRSADS
jgi:hypothetical protein